jgi:transcriptional/translational regulatory protein YebC/TACO1
VKAGGPEPDNNPTSPSHHRRLAKRENMPNANVDRAIKNAMGKDQSGYQGGILTKDMDLMELLSLLMQLTDNTTRTVANVRSCFQ